MSPPVPVVVVPMNPLPNYQKIVLFTLMPTNDIRSLSQIKVSLRHCILLSVLDLLRDVTVRLTHKVAKRVDQM